MKKIAIYTIAILIACKLSYFGEKIVIDDRYEVIKDCIHDEMYAMHTIKVAGVDVFHYVEKCENWID